LKQGAVPLDILVRTVDDWIAAVNLGAY